MSWSAAAWPLSCGGCGRAASFAAMDGAPRPGDRGSTTAAPSTDAALPLLLAPGPLRLPATSVAATSSPPPGAAVPWGGVSLPARLLGRMLPLPPELPLLPEGVLPPVPCLGCWGYVVASHCWKSRCRRCLQ